MPDSSASRRHSIAGNLDAGNFQKLDGVKQMNVLRVVSEMLCEAANRVDDRRILYLLLATVKRVLQGPDDEVYLKMAVNWRCGRAAAAPD